MKLTKAIRCGSGLSPLVLALISALVVVGCEKPPPPPAKGPPDVTVLTVNAKDTPIAFEFVGQTQSSREVEIRARVDGFLERRLYTEGDVVQVDQPLFQLDRKPFEATLQSAKGQLAQQQAALQVAQETLARVKPLAEQNALSKKDLDDAVGNVEKSRAAVFAAEGQVQTAQLNLGYTMIKSPLKGLSSAAKLQEGSYLSQSNSLLTYVAQLDPIWVNFSISENEVLRYRESVASNRLRVPKNNEFEVEVVLADGTVFPNRGRISFADPSFSKDTGTFLVRAVLANPKGQLRPGQFVKVRLIGAVRPQGIVVPQRAVQQGAKSHFVWVATKDGKAEQRVVDVGTWNGDDWFIDQGLVSGDQVIVDGAIRVAQGAPLKISPYTPPPSSASASKAAEPTPIEKDQVAGSAASKMAAQAKAAPSPAQQGVAQETSGSAPSGASARNAPTNDVAGGASSRGASAVASMSVKVQFDSGSDLLDADTAAMLAPISRALQNQPDARADITGYTDKTGGNAHNIQLAKDRAKAVRAALVGQGVSAKQLRLVAPKNVTGGDDDAAARRVDVSIVGKSATQ